MLHSRYNLILIALFAALSVVGAFVKIPTPLVPFTLQTLFCVYAGFLLGARRGFASQLLYLLIGLIGIPVFALGGGPSYVLQPRSAICSDSSLVLPSADILSSGWSV